MGEFKRVEDIDVWKESRSLAVSIYRISSDGPWAKDYGLRDQIRRASVLVACNIAEGFARETDIEFCRFLAIARGSATEVKTQVYIAFDLGYVDAESFKSLYAQIDRICRMLTGLMQYLRGNKSSGPTTDDRRPVTKRSSN